MNDIICPKCDLYYPGHATGSLDICTCYQHENPNPETGNWMPMDKAPKDGSSVILASPSGKTWGNCRWKQKQRAQDRWECSGLGRVPFEPVAWMPMPKYNPQSTDVDED